MKSTWKLATLVALVALLATPVFAAGTTSAKSTTVAKTAATTTAKPAAAKPAAASTKPAAPLIDINTASRDDLVKVPGIGEAIADKIIAGRPWKQKSDVLAKGVANKAQYAKMRTHIIAKQK